MIGLSAVDAVAIAKLDQKIKERRRKCRVLEVDRNGTVLLSDNHGKIRRYSEKLISSRRDMIAILTSHDAHDLGYRVGYRDGVADSAYKQKLSHKLKARFSNIFSMK